jgi:hypothetical protein
MIFFAPEKNKDALEIAKAAFIRFFIVSRLLETIFVQMI